MEKKKIKFKLEGHNLWGFEKPGLFDYETDEERDEALKQREGWLLDVTYETFTKDNGESVTKPCAVVEDSDGTIYRISTDNVIESL